MIIRNLKNKLSKKITKRLILSILIILLIIFLNLKGEFFYNVVNYIAYYYDYYVSEYLHGISENLYLGGLTDIYVEGELQNILSSVYLYGVTLSNILYPLIIVIVTFVVFSKISSEYYNEIYEKASVSKITRIGINKYINNSLISNSLYYGLLMMLPKIIYLLILLIFFPTGTSFNHYISSATFIDLDTFLYQSYSMSPYLLIAMDFVMAFFYGVIVYFISLGVVSLNKKVPMSYFVFVFIMSLLSLIPSFLNQVPIIFYHSIYWYFANTIQQSNYFLPIIMSISLSLIIGVIVKLIYKKVVTKNL